jgi:hypothetical protein
LPFAKSGWSRTAITPSASVGPAATPLLSFLSHEVSRHVVIRHDYGLYEYTAYVYKNPTAPEQGGAKRLVDEKRPV